MLHVKGEGHDREQGSVTPHCMTLFMRHSYRDCADQIVPGDVNKWHKCKTCASVVALEEIECQEEDNGVLKTAYISPLPSC